jgi:protein-S-isoprenylcysteine O-methyltransferase Ste14
LKSIRQWLASTSNRTFVFWPLVVLVFEAALNAGVPAIHSWALVLMAWGYLQYLFVGRYRTRKGGGGPGLSNPPDTLVTNGPYRCCRNPMYLGHLIFLSGLALLFASWAAAALVVFHAVWFDLRVRRDEAHMRELFAEAYPLYMARVKRWLPGLY